MNLFIKNLYPWHITVERDLPWKSNKDPYQIWISEIILQQTRVEQGKPYYLRFIKKWPTIFDLASASQEEVLTLWQGLGYYSRGRNLLVTAKEIVNKYHGIFPTSKDELLQLKGIGDYTASAILSFAHDLPYPVIDGNVKRVISRYFGISLPVDSTEGIKSIEKNLQTVFDFENPSHFNQAIMDFGALVCTPSPKCSECPFNEQCNAFANGTVSILPVKEKKTLKKDRFLNFIFIHNHHNFIIHQRKEKDIWEGLFQFPVIEAENLTENDINNLFNIYFDEIKELKRVAPISGQHILTHQLIRYTIHQIETSSIPEHLNSPYLSIKFSEAHNYAFPQILKNFLNKLSNS
jgi:A/G-specific adenine glycosylase